MKKFGKVTSMALAGAMVLSMTAMADETWKIGGIGPTSGGAAVYGNAVANAMKLAADEINEAGGINGYQVEINFQDDENDAEKTVNAYNTLKDWGMDILEGTVTSAPCIAVAAESVNDNMFQITPSGSAVDCTANPNVFRVCFSDPAQGELSSRYIGDHKLAEKVAIIYNSQDVYSSGIRETFLKDAEDQPFEIVADEAFTEDSKTDFSVQLQKAKDAGADLVFMPIYYTEASLILTQAAGMDFAPQFFGVDGMDGILDVEGFDTTLAEDLMLLTPFVATASDEATQSFTSKFQEQFGGIPNQFAADAYDGLYIIKQYAEAGNLTPDMDVADICAGMQEQIASGVPFDGLTGAGTTWNADGEPTKEPKAMIIKNGVYESLEEDGAEATTEAVTE